MLGDAEGQALTHPADRALESLVAERLQTSAAIADEMVMMPATTTRGLIA